MDDDLLPGVHGSAGPRPAAPRVPDAGGHLVIVPGPLTCHALQVQIKVSRKIDKILSLQCHNAFGICLNTESTKWSPECWMIGYTGCPSS